MGSAAQVLIVAGEASADAHGASVMASLKSRRPDVSFFGVGGPAMRDHGLDAVAYAERIAVAGLTEVLFAIPRIWRIMRRLEKIARQRQPAVAVLIDLPDFNLRLARRLKRIGIPVVYYVSPQIWAWRTGRVKQIRELVSQMLVVLPFEQSFYQEHNVRVRFVGHPLVDQLSPLMSRETARQELGFPPRPPGPLVALLPGSRRKEVVRHLPIMLRGVQLLRRDFPDVQAVLPVASTIPHKLVSKMVAATKTSVIVLDGESTKALVAADAAVVCSGTATLQAALLSRPMVVVYRVSWLSFQILKRLVKVAHIALVNLIAGRRLVPELLQKDFTSENVHAELRTLLKDPMTRMRLQQDFALVRKLIGGPGAADRVANVILSYLPDKTSPTANGTDAPSSGKLWA